MNNFSSYKIFNLTQLNKMHIYIFFFKRKKLKTINYSYYSIKGRYCLN